MQTSSSSHNASSVSGVVAGSPAAEPLLVQSPDHDYALVKDSKFEIRRESMRGWLAIGFSSAYVLVAIASAGFILFSNLDEKRITILFSTVMPTFGALVGTIIGFYFGESKGADSPSDQRR